MTRRCHCLLIAVVTLLPWCFEARAASPFDEAGRFYVQSFAPADYGAHEQNWAVVQDDRGLVYVANGDGVLEYDGVSWRLIPVANRSTARSLAVDVEGRIWVGASGELGYLAADPAGRLRYVSLVEHVPEQDRDFADVWKTHALPDGVYFQSNDRLFRWQAGRMEVWRPETRFFAGHVVDDTFYVQTWEGELLTMAGDTLRPAPGGSTFGGERIYALLPEGADAYLAITRSQGIFRCRDGAGEEEACARFSPGLTDLLAELKVYCATELADGSIALGTLRGGVVLLDRAGHLRRVLNEASGLRGETVWATFVDRQGGLWLGLKAMGELAGEVRDLLAGQVAECGAEVVIAPDLPVVRGDRTRLQQLLQNLMQNALQYMGEQPAPRVDVGARPGEEGRGGVIFVRDNGVGIAPEHQKKIFELFQRLDAATEGTGVGLALVQRIVEVHGGRIWVESAPPEGGKWQEGAGRGSTFCFTLPG